MELNTEPVIQFIISQQEVTGSFATYESYPVVNPAGGWSRLPDPSPFITANILFSLLQLKDPRLKPVIEKGTKNLLASKEGAGFWRFWPVKSRQHPLPLDMDDTCIVSTVLTRCGHHFNNSNILLNNKNDEGYFETWLSPRLSNLFASPAVTYSFFKDYLLASPTHKLRYFSYRDKEPAIAANALLYLGENNQTKACINQIVKEVTSGTMPRKFYDDDVVIYYHISRAYANGINSFKELSNTIAQRLAQRFTMSEENVLLRCMAANILLDFGLELKLAEDLLLSVANSECYPDKWLTVAYFCSNDKNFLAGSPALAAAVFAEGCAKLNRKKQ